jgi:hypothetical protein
VADVDSSRGPESEREREGERMRRGEEEGGDWVLERFVNIGNKVCECAERVGRVC